MSIGFHSFPPQCIIQIWFRSVQCSHHCHSNKVWCPAGCRDPPWLICPIIVVVPQWAGSEWLCFSSVFSSPSLVCHWHWVPRTCTSSCCATPLKRRCCTCSPRCVQLDDSLDQSPSAGRETRSVNERYAKINQSRGTKIRDDIQFCKIAFSALSDKSTTSE